ncbi:hypothetical protein DV737_g3886, partial [Chaetothyriales sp. CBS 132003]
MGQTLSEPVVEKLSDSGADDLVLYGLSAMQGWRISMEDAHTAVLDLQADAGKSTQATPPDKRISFFGVYDGHGGEKVAQFAGEHLHKIVAKQDAFAKGDMDQALKEGFLATDRAILNDARYEDEVSGCTASVGILTKKHIWVANAGDSRTVLGVKGRAKPLSYDHKPQNEGEKARISAAGGFVDFGRVNGNLALSRAIGDFEFKKSADLSPEQQIVTAFPDVIQHEITEYDEFLVIACDGIWDCQTSQAVIEFVRRGIAAKQELYRICENMMDNCLASNSETGGVGCDNMTMIVIGLLNGKTKEEWYDMIGKRVADGDAAEFRGPGVRHQFDQDSPDEYEDMNHRRGGFGRNGRIILLGDGTEVLTDSDEPDMFDHHDSPSALSAGQANAAKQATADTGDVESGRSEREGTPGPGVEDDKSPSAELPATWHKQDNTLRKQDSTFRKQDNTIQEQDGTMSSPSTCSSKRKRATASDRRESDECTGELQQGSAVDASAQELAESDAGPGPGHATPPAKHAATNSLDSSAAPPNKRARTQPNETEAQAQAQANANGGAPDIVIGGAEHAADSDSEETEQGKGEKKQQQNGDASLALDVNNIVGESQPLEPPPRAGMRDPVGGYKTNAPPEGRRVRVYADGVFDLFHLGHMRQLQQAKTAFPNTYLLVGVTGDVETHKRKGLTVLTGAERAETVRHCKWVDEVIPNCPWIVTPDFLAEHQIDYVAHDDEPYGATEGDDIYAPIKREGKFLVTERTEGVSTTGIITKIVRDYEKYIARQLKRGTTRQELNVSWLKKNELDIKRQVQELRETIKTNWTQAGGELGRDLRALWQPSSSASSRPASPLRDSNSQAASPDASDDEARSAAGADEDESNGGNRSPLENAIRGSTKAGAQWVKEELKRDPFDIVH